MLWSPNLHLQAHVSPMRSTSIGWLHLKSADPRHYPIIQPNYLATDRDRWEMRTAVRRTREILAQPAFDEFRGAELAPGPDVTSDRQIDAFVRAMCDSAYHPSCTCAMGVGPQAVVDPECRVYGVEHLRVVDASIMPSIVSGNLNAPTIMVAEKAADIILGNEPLPKIDAPVWRPKHPDQQRDTRPIVPWPVSEMNATM